MEDANQGERRGLWYDRYCRGHSTSIDAYIANLRYDYECSIDRAFKEKTLNRINKILEIIDQVYKTPIDDFKNIIISSTSWEEAASHFKSELKFINLLKTRVEKEKIDVSHFLSC